MELLQLTPAQLRQAATLKEQIQELELEVSSILGDSEAARSQKLHWTQTPAGKARLSRALERSWRNRRSKPATKRASGNGKHWTQTPAGRAKMAKLMQNRWKARKRA